MASCAEADLPEPVLSNEPGSFPWRVLAQRHPALIEQVRAAFPYEARHHAALDALARSCAEGVLEPLPAEAQDAERWNAWGREHFGRSWFDAPFLALHRRGCSGL